MMLSETTDIQTVIRPNRAANIGDKSPPRAGAEPPGKPMDENPAFRVDAHPGPEGLADIDAVKEKRNAMARTIHKVDTTMENIDGQMSRMKDRLLQIVKHYPPYPPGSQERSDYLKTFTTMRRLIDRLTFPQNQDESLPTVNNVPAEEAPPVSDEATPENAAPRRGFARGL